MIQNMSNPRSASIDISRSEEGRGVVDPVDADAVVGTLAPEALVLMMSAQYSGRASAVQEVLRVQNKRTTHRYAVPCFVYATRLLLLLRLCALAVLPFDAAAAIQAIGAAAGVQLDIIRAVASAHRTGGGCSARTFSSRRFTHRRAGAAFVLVPTRATSGDQNYACQNRKIFFHITFPFQCLRTCRNFVFESRILNGELRWFPSQTIHAPVTVEPSERESRPGYPRRLW